MRHSIKSRAFIIIILKLILMANSAEFDDYTSLSLEDNFNEKTHRISEENSGNESNEYFANNSNIIKVYQNQTKLKLLIVNEKKIPSNVVENFPNLIIFEAHFCGFTSLTKDNFHKLEKLETLKLLNGELTDICSESFDNLKYLTNLILSSNEIKFLHPKTFSKLRNLKKLDLSQNSIEILHPKLFESLESLEVLRISHNDIIFIDERQFSHNLQLMEVHLDQNNLKIIHENAFNNLISLKVINLDINQCTGYDFMSENVEEVKAIILSSCKAGNEKTTMKIHDKIHNYNNWYRGSYINDKCGKFESENFNEIVYNKSSRNAQTIPIIFGLINSLITYFIF